MSQQPRMTQTGRKPRLVAPPGACETHSHIYGPKERYPHHPGRSPDLIADVPAFERVNSLSPCQRLSIGSALPECPHSSR